VGPANFVAAMAGIAVSAHVLALVQDVPKQETLPGSCRLL